MVLDQEAFSPKPIEHSGSALTMTFSEAVRQMVENGAKITRLEWGSNDEYGYTGQNSILIHTKGKDHKWLITEGDYLANDWVTLPI